MNSQTPGPAKQQCTLTGADGRPYPSTTKGTWGGHRARKIYGRLDCPAALRAIARGGYVNNRVFFIDETTAVQAGYRPCGTCCPVRYRAWKAAKERTEAMAAVTSPLLRDQAQLVDVEPEVTSEAIEGLISLARSRGAQRIAIGTSRDHAAIAAGQSLGERWVGAGGAHVLELTWPETAASWLRQATRFAAADADLWIMFGRPQGWAQMTRRLLWSTSWSPASTVLAGAVADRVALDLVGLHNLRGIAGVTRSGHSWHLPIDDRIITATRTGS